MKLNKYRINSNKTQIFLLQCFYKTFIDAFQPFDESYFFNVYNVIYKYNYIYKHCIQIKLIPVTKPANAADISTLQEVPENVTTLPEMAEKEKKSQEMSEKEKKSQEMSEKVTTSDSSSVTMRNKKENQKKKKKLTTNDVGGPLNFVHVSHMSWGVTDGPHVR